jgi:hypothetical protein
MPIRSGDDEMDTSSFASGSIVRETGLAVVHENERILPAPGSQAAVEPAGRNLPGAVEYSFPVEIVVVGGLSDAERERIEAGIWARLATALERLA